jgi:hypothetical protein
VSVTYFRLTEDFVVDDLMTWYYTAVVGDIAVIPLPTRPCRVRLVCGDNQQVGWESEGGRMMTMSLADAVWRLLLLYSTPHHRGYK